MSENNPKSAGNQNIVQLVLMGLLIGAAFFIGFLWNKVQTMEGTAAGANTVVNGQAPNPGLPPNQDPTQAAGDVTPVSADDHVRGNRDARIALIEYSDFDCPFCTRFHATAQQVVDEFGGDVMWVFRHFPLDTLHPNARKKAEATECVAKLGGNDAFWTFTDALMDPAGTVTVDQLGTLASQAGVDAAAFNNCLTSGETADAVNADFSSGQSAGVRGTPGNILLDTQSGETSLIPGALPFDSLKPEIDSMLAN